MLQTRSVINKCYKEGVLKRVENSYFIYKTDMLTSIALQSKWIISRLQVVQRWDLCL